jgi:hypothetical protein
LIFNLSFTLFLFELISPFIHLTSTAPSSADTRSVRSRLPRPHTALAREIYICSEAALLQLRPEDRHAVPRRLDQGLFEDDVAAFDNRRPFPCAWKMSAIRSPSILRLRISMI